MSIINKPDIPEAEIHLALQELVRNAVQYATVIPPAELDRHIARLRRGESLGPIMDPTLYRANADSLRLELYVCEQLKSFCENVRTRALLLAPARTA